VFALLKHTTCDDVHWDFIIEVPGCALLPTWRLLKDPLACPGDIAAKRIADHRPLFLDYEGKLSGNRGRVRRLDRGEAVVEQFGPRRLVATLDGGRLQGRIEIAVEPDGRVWFRKIEDRNQPNAFRHRGEHDWRPPIRGAEGRPNARFAV
jgi:hypothetical protein